MSWRDTHYWRMEVHVDYRCTLWELAVEGLMAEKPEDLPQVPEGADVEIRKRDIGIAPYRFEHTTTPISVLGETKEELEQLGALVYARKTTKKETGRCYYKGYRHMKGDPDLSWTANFLKLTTHLTRMVVLGPVLASSFELAMANGENAGDWVERSLGKIRFQPELGEKAHYLPARAVLRPAKP